LGGAEETVMYVVVAGKPSSGAATGDGVPDEE
jgi:hypothetical protein